MHMFYVLNSDYTIYCVYLFTYIYQIDMTKVGHRTDTTAVKDCGARTVQSRVKMRNTIATVCSSVDCHCCSNKIVASLQRPFLFTRSLYYVTSLRGDRGRGGIFQDFMLQGEIT